ncbi:RING zinc finger-containing protein [Cavenderia fasciculata]|uniref:RING zinc finger-containing protein n=1 Tax=Cavenderia fasciculata TaxID=261658 RepID=F4QC00_CACFS|nr:RING zinc finger-containing protein [Cavenderia fasciculata]EGG14738.1 RING zinc finger-containing protein [Cavenderia fasciculata]|eukprot:XP_004351246.1 RING zinc finger-containing protein [Cavenderia fasciculata]
MTDITENDDSVSTTTTTKPTAMFKRPNKNRNNMMRRKETDDEDEQKSNNNENEQVEDESSSLESEKKKLKPTKVVNQYTTATEKKADFSYNTSGSAKAMMTEADQTSTIVERDDEKDNPSQLNNNDGIYRGMKAYTNFVQKKEDLSYKGAGVKAGPIKQLNTNYKGSCRFDYQPSVCKDYKDTGQCSFGDACIYLHDRSDYKQGWQIDKDYEEEQRKGKRGFIDPKDEKKRDFKANGNGSDAIDEEDLPFACFICKKPFDNPVMTKCKHFFCESCALDHNAKSKKCFVCKQPTNGSFLQPKRIIDKLMEKSKMMEQQKQQEEVSES